MLVQRAYGALRAAHGEKAAAYRKCSVDELLAYYRARSECLRECREMDMDVVTTAQLMCAIPTPNRKDQQ